MKASLPVHRTQRIVRIMGAAILAACAVMIVLGTTVWEQQLRGPQYALYWSWCFLLAVVAIFCALWDMLLVRRAFKRNRRELFREEFMTDDFAAKLRDAIRKDEQRK